MTEHGWRPSETLLIAGPLFASGIALLFAHSAVEE
jgi:hypothetical protein